MAERDIVSWHPRAGDGGDDWCHYQPDPVTSEAERTVILAGQKTYPTVVTLTDVNDEDAKGFNQVIAEIKRRTQSTPNAGGVDYIEPGKGSFKNAVRDTIKEKIDDIREYEYLPAFEWSEFEDIAQEKVIFEMRKALRTADLWALEAHLTWPSAMDWDFHMCSVSGHVCYTSKSVRGSAGNFKLDADDIRKPGDEIISGTGRTGTYAFGALVYNDYGVPSNATLTLKIQPLVDILVDDVLYEVGTDYTWSGTATPTESKSTSAACPLSPSLFALIKTITVEEA